MIKHPETISQIVDRYWSFDDGQVHTHSWHDKQDCLDIIRKIEAGFESSFTALRIENGRMREIVEKIGAEVDSGRFGGESANDFLIDCLRELEGKKGEGR